MSDAEGATALLLGLDPTLLQIVRLSLRVSLTASFAAMVVGLPLGAALAAGRFPGRPAIILIANALLGLPPVVVGLALYLLLSRAGPLGRLGLLFTPAAMILAQFLLAVPIVTALAHRSCAGHWDVYGGELLVVGAPLPRRIAMLLAIARTDMMTASLAGFGRSISEVGAILIVGGNIAGVTRTMTTAITLETSEGNFAFALALGCIVVGISLLVSAITFALSSPHDRRRFW